MNKIALMGRLARDPELRSTPAGISVANFTLAVDRDRVNKETGERGVDFIDCVAWRNVAEFAAKYLSKGRKVGLIGSLQIRKWEAKDGSKRKSAEVVVENIYFADSERVSGSQDEDRHSELPELGIPQDDDYPF